MFYNEDFFSADNMYVNDYQICKKDIENIEKFDRINLDVFVGNDKHQKITRVVKPQPTTNTSIPKFVCPVYTGESKNHNMFRYVYARLYAEIYKSGCSEIIEPTGMIYSWAKYLLGLYNRQVILWFDIVNVDEKNSKLIYVFNHSNKIPEYEEYLRRVEYCIDHNL